MSPEKNENSVDLGTFEATALPHMNDLYRAASSILRNPTEAEDVVQETFLQAWKSFHRFETGTNCRAWLFKIMFHVIDHHRRKWYRLNLVKDEEVNLEELLVYEPHVAENITDADVLAAFKEIPAPYREVVLLSDVYEFSYKEIQDTLGIPAGTVMSRLSRGRQLLRSQLTRLTPPTCPPLSMAQAL